MKYIKQYNIFLEDAGDSGSTAGMGDVVSSQPGVLPGTTGTIGSGDIGFPLTYGKGRKGKRKVGNASEVSDLRDLKPVKIKRLKY